MKFTPNRKGAGEVERVFDRSALGIPCHWDRLFRGVVAAGDAEQKIAGSYFSRAVADVDFDGGFGGIGNEMDLVDPKGGGGTEFDFANYTVPDRLGIFDVGVGATDIELLAVVDSKKKIVFSRGGGGEIEFVGGAE